MLRRLVTRHCDLALCLVIVALCMKLLVPGGFMPTMANGTITVSMCSGIGPMTIAIPGLAGTADIGDPSSGDGETHMPCAFVGLGLTSLTPVDPIVLAIAIAFIMATGFAAVTRRSTRRADHLRPPLRGPPLTA